jgi:hypothetical protein
VRGNGDDGSGGSGSASGSGGSSNAARSWVPAAVLERLPQKALREIDQIHLPRTLENRVQFVAPREPPPSPQLLLYAVKAAAAVCPGPTYGEDALTVAEVVFFVVNAVQNYEVKQQDTAAGHAGASTGEGPAALHALQRLELPLQGLNALLPRVEKIARHWGETWDQRDAEVAAKVAAALVPLPHGLDDMARASALVYMIIRALKEQQEGEGAAGASRVVMWRGRAAPEADFTSDQNPALMEELEAALRDSDLPCIRQDMAEALNRAAAATAPTSADSRNIVLMAASLIKNQSTERAWRAARDAEDARYVADQQAARQKRRDALHARIRRWRGEHSKLLKQLQACSGDEAREAALKDKLEGYDRVIATALKALEGAT